MKKGIAFISAGAVVLSAVLLLSHCGSSTTTSTAKTYATSSNAGDFAAWTLNTAVSPVTFSVVWTITDATGAASSVLNVSGTCGDPDATYVFRKCTVATSSAVSGTATPPAAGTVFDVLELPGTALIVHPETAAGRSDASQDEVHVGVSLNDCGTLPGGDYVGVNTAPSNNSQNGNIFNISRVDGKFTGSTHADFNLYQVATSFQMQYGTSTPNETFTSTTCSNGVYTIVSNGATVRLGATSSGLYIVDRPRGDGGQFVVNVNNAATINDVANKNMVILAFQQGGTQLLSITTGAVTGGGSAITAATAYGGGSIGSMPTLYPVTATTNGTPTKFAFAAGQQGLYTSTTNNAIYGTYPTASTLPGMFYTTDTNSGNDTPTMIIGFKDANGKLMVVGSNTKRGSGSGYYVSGVFVGFQK